MKQFTQSEITLAEMSHEIRRELATRRKVYPRWIEEGRIKRDAADFRVRVLEALLEYLQEKLKRATPQGDLFQ